MDAKAVMGSEYCLRGERKSLRVNEAVSVPVKTGVSLLYLEAWS
jgi:hypothetical protein